MESTNIIENYAGMMMPFMASPNLNTMSLNLNQQMNQQMMMPQMSNSPNFTAQSTGDQSSDDSDDDSKPFRPSSRSNYSTTITKVLNRWFKAHLDNPYPTEEERIDICEKTGLTRKQLRVWLINSRKVSVSLSICFDAV